MSAETPLIPELALTDDGSHTYLHPRHGASYRSSKGAATESRWVFLQGSRLAQRPSPWRVLELGFGSGLNFQLTNEAARAAKVELCYVALEPEPMAAPLWLVDDLWRPLQWGIPISNGGSTLTVHRARWQDFTPPAGAFDALYHDPFGPAVAPECWGPESFRWAAAALADTGVLATYGASSAARHAMRAAGLWVGVLPGAPGKREMTVAALRPEAIEFARPWKSKSYPSA